MQLKIEHRTQYAYDPEVGRVSLRLRLFPAAFAGQMINRWSVTVNGEPVTPLLTDGFGDGVGLWHAKRSSDVIEILAEGLVTTEDRAGVVRGLSQMPPAGIFLSQTKLTAPDSRIRDLAHAVPDGQALDRLHALMAAVGEAMTYKPAATTAKTTAAEALRGGAGVCQDYSHVFMSAARVLGIPARYVTGYVLASHVSTNDAHSAATSGPETGSAADKANEGPDEGPDEGIVETHAWAEAYADGLGWVGFDPVHAVSPTGAYVRLACGLDANAAAPIRGCLSTPSDVTMETAVVVLANGAQVQSQSQSQS
ncbi:MAG: transglutaminase family protein [Pseudomonadota bacterium]